MEQESTDHPSLDRYLQKARDAWIDGELPPSPERLREVAESIDMTVEASEAADHRASNLCARAQEAIDSGDDSRAESMLEEAYLLSPTRLQPLFLLAQIYAERYGEEGDELLRETALELTDLALEIDPEHTPTRSLVEKLGTSPQVDLPWKTAAKIVLVIVVISGSMQLCNRYMTPEVTDEQTEEVREYLEEHGEPPR